MYTGKYAKDGGFYYMKTEGLFSIFTREGVSSNVNRRIKIGRLELDQGIEKKDGRPEQWQPRWLSHERRRELAGERG